MTLSQKFRQLLMPLMIVPLLLVASCGGSDDGQASKSANAGQSNSSDANDADEDSDKQRVCKLLTDDEVREATGFEVISAEGDNMGLPVCEWELSVPESVDDHGLPGLSMILLSESDYRMRVDPLSDSLQDVDGPADEMKLHFIGGGDTGIPAMATFFALKGNQGIHVILGVNIWKDEATAKSELPGLTGKIFDRI